MEIRKFQLVVEYIMDRINDTDQGIFRTIEVILEDEIIKGISNQIKIIEDKL